MCILQPFSKENAHFKQKRRNRKVDSDREKQYKMETELDNDPGGRGNKKGVQVVYPRLDELRSRVELIRRQVS